MLIAANDNLNTEDMFSYELCTYPTELFDSPGVPRLADKAALADSLVEPYYIAYHGPEMFLFKRYVMTTSATCEASMENVWSCLMATLMAQQ